MAIEKQVGPLLAISFSDYEHGQFNPACIIGINEEGSFSRSHINTKLLMKPKEIWGRMFLISWQGPIQGGANGAMLISNLKFGGPNFLPPPPSL